MRITAETILEEIYGLNIEEILKLDELCKKHNVAWYELFYWEEDMWDLAMDYFIKKYNLKPKTKWRKDLSMVFLNYSPTSSKERYLESRSKVADDNEIQKILNKAEPLTTKKIVELIEVKK